MKLTDQSPSESYFKKGMCQLPISIVSKYPQLLWNSKYSSSSPFHLLDS